MVQIDRFDFNNNAISRIQQLNHWGFNVGENWPVVYIINNDSEAYIGETLSARNRVEQHLGNTERQRLTEIRIVTDNNFNKSVALDLEAFLIKHMSADGKFRLQNRNDGLQDHNYYNQSEYESTFRDIWRKLKALGIVRQSLNDVENSELYKYSPYKSLGPEQIAVERKVLNILATRCSQGSNATILIKGGAGTGKTILGIYLVKLFADLYKSGDSYSEITEDFYLDEDPPISALMSSLPKYKKIGIVIPQYSLGTSIKCVFKTINNLNEKMVLTPSEVVKDFINTGVKYDLLIIDEAHRLRCGNKGNRQNNKSFFDCNESMGLGRREGTELEWLLKCSSNQIIFRDELQTVRPCDIDGKRFIDILKQYNTAIDFDSLSHQWRCEGGVDYTDYIKAILDNSNPNPKHINNYDLRLYDDCEKMINDIRKKDSELGLCRNVAGFAWKWLKGDDINTPDITIQGKKNLWNTTQKNWVLSPNSINEIGCIHTIQGYDLNYCGVIIGEDLKYNPETKKIYADKSCYFDQQGKAGVAKDPDALCQYLCNIYLTLLTRGIKGTYIYVCNDALREYIRKYIL